MIAIAQESHKALSTFSADCGGETIALRGEVDEAVALNALVDTVENGSTEVRIDMSKVTFIDASGLRTLTHARAHLAHDERRLVILDPSRAVIRAFGLARVADLFLTDEH
jgi:anti-anti-sigma factor